MVELLSRRNEWLLVVDMDSKEILYCNKKREKGSRKDEFCKTCKNRLSFRNEILKWNRKEQYKVWAYDQHSDK